MGFIKDLFMYIYVRIGNSGFIFYLGLFFYLLSLHHLTWVLLYIHIKFFVITFYFVILFLMTTCGFQYTILISLLFYLCFTCVHYSNRHFTVPLLETIQWECQAGRSPREPSHPQWARRLWGWQVPGAQHLIQLQCMDNCWSSPRLVLFIWTQDELKYVWLN